MSYVDGYLLAVPKKHLKAYQKMARDAGKVWMKHGALKYVEAAGDDLDAMDGLLPFAKTVKAKPDEIVIFSFVLFKSRKHRDAVNKKVFQDPYMTDPKMQETDMPFDMKRMAYGGFSPIVDL